MKKDVVMYKNGNIVDFRGESHPFVVCALSTSDFNLKEDVSLELNVYDNYEGTVVGSVDIPRAVFVGIAVCNPIDVWDEEKGKMIALSKAKGFKAIAPEKSAAIFTTRAGMISEGLVEALLIREVQHVQDDPEYVIKGYNRMKERYEMEIEKQKYLDETPDNLKELGTQLSTLSESDIERVINVALIKSE